MIFTSDINSWIFTSGLNISHAAEAYSGILLNESLVLHLEQSSLFPAFKMAAILSWWKVADPLYFYWSVLSSDNGSDLKVCSTKRDLFAHPLLCSSLQCLEEADGCGIDDL